MQYYYNKYEVKTTLSNEFIRTAWLTFEISGYWSDTGTRGGWYYDDDIVTSWEYNTSYSPPEYQFNGPGTRIRRENYTGIGAGKFYVSGVTSYPKRMTVLHVTTGESKESSYYEPDPDGSWLDPGWRYQLEVNSYKIKETPGAGTLVQSNIVANDGTYPNNGKHTDGYWYIRGASTNKPPGAISSVTVAGGVIYSGVLHDVLWTAPTDPEGDSVSYWSEVQYNGGSWVSLVKHGASPGISNRVGTSTNTVRYRISPIDLGGSGQYGPTTYSPTYTVVHNQPPTMPGSIGWSGGRVGDSAYFYWGASTQPEGKSFSYQYRYRTNTTSYTYGTTTQNDRTSAWFRIPSGSTLYMEVRAEYESYASDWKTMSTSIETNYAPTTPPSINVPDDWKGGTTSTVSWGASTDANYDLITYYLYRSLNGGSYTQVYSGTSRSHVETAGTNWTTVNYRVRAYDGRDFSGYRTGTQRSVDQNKPPNTPASIDFTAPIGTQSTTITWSAATDPDGDTVRYYLERAINGGSFAAVTNRTTTSYSETVQSTWNTLQYRVRAHDGKVYSTSYRTSSAKTVFHNTAPTVPANIIVPTNPLNGTNITVSWAKSTDPDIPTHQSTITYYIERQLNGGTWSALTNTTSLSISTPVGAWASVAYRVRAFDGMDYSGYRTSLLRTVITNTPPSAPASINITTPVKSTFDTTLTWGVSTDPDSGDTIEYYVERQFNSGSWSTVASGTETRTRIFTENIPITWNTLAYRVRAHDGIEYGAYKTLATQTVIHNTPPTTPASISVPVSARDGDSLYISWATSTDADDDPITYDLEQRIDEGSWEPLINTPDTHYYDTAGLWEVVQYRVRASTPLHKSVSYATSETVQVTINLPPTTPPTITVPSLNSYSTATISWGKSTDPNEDLVLYDLERKIGSGSWIRILGSSETRSYVETPQVEWKNGVQYRVLAKDESGATSGYRTSPVVTVKHNIPPTAPVASITPPRSGTPTTISWTASTDADGDPITYVVERKINSGGFSTLISGLTVLETVDNPLEEWNTVAYRVRAYDTIDYGPYSNIVTSDVQHFPDFQMKINGELKSSADGWVKVGGELRKIDSIWTRINGVLKKI